MVVSQVFGSDGGVDIIGGGDLHLPPPEHRHKVHFGQAHYGPVYGGREAYGVTCGQALVGTVRLGIGRDADGVSVGVTDRGGGGRQMGR